MRRFVLTTTMLAVFLFGCAYQSATQPSGERDVKEYSATAVSLSDFSMKIMAHYQAQNLPIPSDFDLGQFFALLEKIYPDQSRVSSVKDNYQVSVRPLDGGYSVMLCDRQTGRKIMEDLSCCPDRVEIRSWQSDSIIPCVFERNWMPLCKCQ